jgi:hypothetical protein
MKATPAGIFDLGPKAMNKGFIIFVPAAARDTFNRQFNLVDPATAFLINGNHYTDYVVHPEIAIYQVHKKELVMGIGTILIIILILLLVGGLPIFPHSRSWGYGPSGIIGTILVILLILVLLGRI